MSAEMKPIAEGVLTLWIPRPPDNANARGHSKAQNRIKRKYWAELAQRLALRWHVDPPPSVPFAKARIAVTYYVRDRRGILDTDNAMRRLKPVADFLVGHGYLAGDTPDRLEWTIPAQEVIESGSLPPLCSVRITLTQVDR